MRNFEANGRIPIINPGVKITHFADPAFPFQHTVPTNDGGAHTMFSYGLTKLEYLTAMIAANGVQQPKYALQIADACLKAAADFVKEQQLVDAEQKLLDAGPQQESQD